MSALHAWSGRTIESISKNLASKKRQLERISKGTDERSRRDSKRLGVEIDELLEK
jgi:hypothetical protein